MRAVGLRPRPAICGNTNHIQCVRLEQRWSLFQAYCAHFQLECPAALEYSVGKLHLLTPGDFAVVAKCARITPITSAQHLLDLLQAERALKENGSKGSFGFV